MLTRLAIKNFKSIGDPGIDLELRPLTFLVGKNGAGKSSVLQMLMLLKQSRGSSTLELQGTLKLGSYSDIVYKLEAKRTLEVTLTIKIGMLAGYPYDTALIYDLDFLTGNVASSGVSFVIDGEKFPLSPQRSVGVGSLGGDLSSLEEKFPSDFLNSLLQKARSLVLDRLERLFYIPTLRGFTKLTHQQSSGAGGLENVEDFVWTANQAAATILAENPSIEEEVSSRMKMLYGIEIVHRLAPQANIVLETKEGRTRRNIINEGFGLNQVLFLVIKLVTAPIDSLICIEEPEISLHPEAQVEMTKLLAKSATEGKQILATTHSTFLLMGLSEAVQDEGIGIKPSDVIVHELEKTAEGTKLKRTIELDEKGYLKDWVSSFSKVEKRLMREFLNSLPKGKDIG